MKVLNMLKELLTSDTSDLPDYDSLRSEWIDARTLPGAEPAVEFRGFGKLQRLYDSRHGVVITEKVDGTNGAIHVRDGRVVGVQSRKRLIYPGKDNFGFATWVSENNDLIAEILGDGLHYGEWYGKGIQRGYGLDERRFALFNTSRWKDLAHPDLPQLHGVPELYSGSIEESGLDTAVSEALAVLQDTGSGVNPGYQNYEGIVVHFPDSQTSFKHVVNSPGSKKRTRG